jgi:hypothetical protein
VLRRHGRPLNLPSASLDQGRRGISYEGVLAITLQSTVGGFSPEFMRKLPQVEQAMIAHGLEPAQFVISKDRAAPPALPMIRPFFYEYTVFFGDENFTVTEPNDMIFLDYFYQRCVAEDQPEPAEQPRRRRRGLIRRLFRWMAQPM